MQRIKDKKEKDGFVCTMWPTPFAVGRSLNKPPLFLLVSNLSHIMFSSGRSSDSHIAAVMGAAGAGKARTTLLRMVSVPVPPGHKTNGRGPDPLIPHSRQRLRN